MHNLHIYTYIQGVHQGGRPPHIRSLPIKPSSKCAEKHRASSEQEVVLPERQQRPLQPGEALIPGRAEEEQVRPQPGVQGGGGGGAGAEEKEKEEAPDNLVEPPLLNA